MNSRESVPPRNVGSTCPYCAKPPIYAFTDYKKGKHIIVAAACNQHYKRVRKELYHPKPQSKRTKKIKKTEKSGD
jgi:ribosomal protein L44E